MNGNIITTTTNSIDGATIEKYIDLISTNVVVGTNFFSDFGASITDIFGGLSDTYQNKLQGIYKVGIDKLKLKAANLGADAILGIKIDFDEISGKGKSMFMISVIGTAAKIKFNEENKKSTNIVSDSIVPIESLEQEVTKRIIISKVSNDKLPNKEDWGYLLRFPIIEIAEKLIDIYLLKQNKYEADQSEQETLLITNISNYFRILNENQAIENLYTKIIDNPNPIIKILIENNLFSADEALKLLSSKNTGLAIDCLGISKNYYSNDDLIKMKEIISQVDSLEDLGKIETVKNVLGKSNEKYICPNGHSNDISIEYCLERICKLNTKGLTQNQVFTFENFRIKVESLSSILELNKN